MTIRPGSHQREEELFFGTFTPMDLSHIPDSLVETDQVDSGIAFVSYCSSTAVVKGRATLTKHLISLITEGEKLMYLENETIHLRPGQILILSAGNTLFTQRLSRNARIKSTMIYFNDEVLQEVSSANSAASHRNTAPRPYKLIDRDSYLRSYIESVNVLMAQQLMSPALQLVKLKELLLYLESKHPGTLVQFQTSNITRPDEDRIRQVMESHASSQLSLTDLAFLCHMSLATFKRKFQQIYHESPARWLQIQRLLSAAERLRSRAARPGEVYFEAGYENHSSFSKAFKKYFGVLPKDYG